MNVRSTCLTRGRVANVSKEGGFDQTLRDTLAEYHRVRYTNYGKPLPYEAAAAGLVEEAFVLSTGTSIRNDIRAQFQVVLGDDPTDDELEHWEKFIKRSARKLHRTKGFDSAAAAMGATDEFVEEFVYSPQATYLRGRAGEHGVSGILSLPYPKLWPRCSAGGDDQEAMES